MNLRSDRLALLAIAAACLGTGTTALAQSNVNAGNKFAWGENIGWINFRDANAATQGVRFNKTLGNYFSGFAWGENVGWINFGDGTPANGTAYANTTGADFGVNYDPVTDKVTGLAWGENIGWINFTLPTLPANQQPTFDSADKRLRGYAWGENVGWINLDVAVGGQFVAFDYRCSPADIGCDDGVALIDAPACTNNGVNEGDYNAFFAADGFFFQAGLGPAAVGLSCDIADDAGDPLPPFGVGNTNNGVNEGDYNCFFNFLFLGCL